MAQAFEQLAGRGYVHGGSDGGEHLHVRLLLAVGAPEQDHGDLRAEAFGDGESS